MNEWEAFNRIQPIGARRFDVYYSTLMTAIHNIALAFSGSKTNKKYKVEDFMPNWMGNEKSSEEMSIEDQISFWRAFAEQHNAEVERNNTTPKKLK